AHVVRTGTSIGTTRPFHASNFVSETSAHNTSPSACSPRKRSRIRSTTRPTDGKSIAISSAKHSCGIEVQLTIGSGSMLVKVTREWYGSNRPLERNKNHARRNHNERVSALRRHDAIPRSTEHGADSGQSECHDARHARVGVRRLRLF